MCSQWRLLEISFAPRLWLAVEINHRLEALRCSEWIACGTSLVD